METYLNRRSRLKRVPFRVRRVHPALVRRKLNPYGKKAKLRESINKRNRARFRAMGLYDICEARLSGCWNIDLTWSHGRKDRKLTMDEREFLVIRCCTYCHRIMDEEMSPEEMLQFVQDVIERREIAA